MEITCMSNQALIEELLSPGYGGPEAEEYPACVQETAQLFRSQRLQRTLALAKELLLRDLRPQWSIGPLIDSPAAFRDWLRLRFAGLEHEVFLVIFLDTQHRIIDAEVMFRGTLTQTSVYPREVVKAAMRHNAAAIAVAHNHPSGDPTPSSADKYLTATLRQALALVDVRCIDHFIVAGSHLQSFAELGLM